MHPIDQLRGIDINDLASVELRDDVRVNLMAHGYAAIADALERPAAAIAAIQHDATLDTPRPAVPAAVLRAIATAARGSYQQALLDGREAWSGSSLRGAAKNWSGRYADSRASLILRINSRLSDLDDMYCWRVASQIDNGRRKLFLQLMTCGGDIIWTAEWCELQRRLAR